MFHPVLNSTKSTMRRNALIAGGLGASLLLGGSSYALWAVNSSIEAGQLTAGDLDLVAADAIWWDVSSDRADTGDVKVTTPNVRNGNGVEITLDGVKGHEFDPGTWRIVPGDTVMLTIPFTMVLEGDNLVAKLTINAEDLISDNGFNPSYLPNGNITYSVYDAAGNLLVDKDGVPLNNRALPSSNSQALAYLQAPGVGQDDGEPESGIPYVNPDQTSYIGGAVLALFVQFDDADDYSQGQIDTATQGAGELKFGEAIALSLQQVRCGTVGGEQFTDACS